MKNNWIWIIGFVFLVVYLVVNEGGRISTSKRVGVLEARLNEHWKVTWDLVNKAVEFENHTQEIHYGKEPGYRKY